jgi:hypothetical protein
MKNFDESLITLIQNLNFASESFHPIFKSAYNAAFKKYKEHILIHPCCALFKLRYFFL